MARIRSIHPGLFTDEAFASLSMAARVLLLGVWTEADDHGVFEWKPVSLKMRVMPVDNVDIPALLSECEAAGVIKGFEEGKRYGLVRNFCRYQRPKKPNYVHPMPAEFYTYVGLKEDGSVPVLHQSRTGSEKTSQREEGGNREDGKGGEEGRPRAPIDEDLKRRASAVGAGISAHFLARQLTIPNLERCETWLTMGYAQGTILAAVEAVLKRGTKPATLDYFDGAIRDMHAKAPQTAEPFEVTNKIFVEVGTPEWSAWDQHRRKAENRGWPMTQHQVGRVLKDGWWFLTQWPPGYDETNQTGEEKVA